MAPAVTAQAGQFLAALGLGLALGLCYDCLRTPGHLWGDLLFLPAYAYALVLLWLAVGRGRLAGYCVLGLWTGFFLWRIGPGRYFRAARKKFLKFLKFLFSIGGK